MFILALIIGIYAYGIFTLGLFGLLYKSIIICFTVIFVGLVLIWTREFLLKVLKAVRGFRSVKDKTLYFFIILFCGQVFVNLTGALGPELAYDALWYHLTLPKLYLLTHSITFIPGGLLYYSAMPQFGEMLFVGGLAFGNEVVAKLIHFSFGLFACVALYKLSRKFFDPRVSLIAIVVFYSNLVVGWESTTAYVDLIRTFFEILALWAFINWWPGTRPHLVSAGQGKWLIVSAVMVGLAITTKLLAIGSLVIFSGLFLYRFLDSRFHGNDKSKFRNVFMQLFVYWIIALAVPLPWFLFSFIHTGNPVYPFFTEVYRVVPSSLSLLGFFRDVWDLFTKSSDPISPMYLICLPFIFVFFPKFKPAIKVIGVYSFLAVIVWFFTPRTGGGRFILPYLPAMSIICAASYSEVLKNSRTAHAYLGRFLLCTIIFIAIISIGYRFAANTKYVPVILGYEPKQQFLTEHLNFAYGDFYDTDDYFKKHMQETDRVLLYGFHNEYYVNFPFIDSSWVKETDSFHYIATQNTNLPERFNDWKLVYTNDKTMVKLYKK